MSTITENWLHAEKKTKVSEDGDYGCALICDAKAYDRSIVNWREDKEKDHFVKRAPQRSARCQKMYLHHYWERNVDIQLFKCLSSDHRYSFL
jgi:hypothetical protein